MNIKEKLADAHNNFPMIDSHPALLYAEALNEIVELERRIEAYKAPLHEFNPEPSEDYSALLKQFRASINIIKNKEAQMRLLDEALMQSDMKRHLLSEENLNSEWNMNAKLTVENEELEQKVKELEKDKARLDWLANLDNKIGNVQLPIECIIGGLDGGLRGAIDEAMEIEQ